jgi:hypothetical protein
MNLEKENNRRERKGAYRGKSHLYRGASSPGTNVAPRYKCNHSYQLFDQYKCALSFVPEGLTGTNVPSHLYRRVCTILITCTNERYRPVQMPIFPVVQAHELG